MHQLDKQPSIQSVKHYQIFHVCGFSMFFVYINILQLCNYETYSICCYLF